MRELPEYVRQLQMGSAPMVEYSGSMAAAKQTGQISEQLGQLAVNMHAKDVEIEKLRASSEMDRALNEQFLQAQSDPAALKSLQDGYKKGFLKGIKSPALAEQFSVLYDSQANSLLEKSTQNKIKVQDQEHEKMALEAIDNAIEMGAHYVDNIFSNVPEHVAGAEVALGSKQIAFDTLLTAKNADGSYMFTPAQQVSFKKRLEKGIQAKAEAAHNAAIAEQNLKMTDFAGWAETKGMSVEQILAHAQEQGIDNPDVIGLQKAKAYAEVFKAAPTVDEFANVAAQFKAEYGKYSDKALERLAPNMPMDKAAALKLATGQNAEAYTGQIKALAAISGVKDSVLDEEYRATFTDEKPADLENVVYSSEDVSRNAAAMRNEGNASDALPYVTQVARLAKFYRIQNPDSSRDDAVAFANAYTKDSFHFGRTNKVDYRIPAKLPNGMEIDSSKASEIEGAIGDAITKVEAYAGGRKIVRTDDITAALNTKMDGVFLKSNDTILLGKDGKPVELKFDEMLKLSRAEATATLDEKRKRELFHRRAQGMTYPQRENLRREMYPEAFK